MQLVITARPGLTEPDLAFALYLNGVAIDASAIVLTELPLDAVASDYLVAGLPDAEPAEQYALTWSDGTQSGVRRYPALPAVPPCIVLPIRQTGVTLADVDPHLYLDGVEVSTAALVLTSLGSPFDYSLTGLATPPIGSYYTFTYRWGPVLYSETWPEAVAGINAALVSPSAFVSDFLDELCDIVLAQPGTTDNRGAFIPSGAVASLPCRISDGPELTRDTAGREVVSGVRLIVGANIGLTAHRHRYTLPARYSPRLNLTAVRVGFVNDESGPCYEKVWLP